MDFCTSIHCMDGRVQVPIQNYLKEKYGVKYIDAITEPGPCKTLAESKDKSVIDSIRSRIRISVEKHQSSLIAISGHQDCAGNPNSYEEQREQVLQSIKYLKELHPQT